MSRPSPAQHAVLFVKPQDAVMYLRLASPYFPPGQVTLPVATEQLGGSNLLTCQGSSLQVMFPRDELVANSPHGYPVIFTGDGMESFLHRNQLEEAPEQPYVEKLWPWNRAHNLYPQTAGGSFIYTSQGNVSRNLTLSPLDECYVLARMYACKVQTSTLHTFNIGFGRTGQLSIGDTCYLHSVHMFGTGAMLELVHPDGIVRLRDGTMLATCQKDAQRRSDTCEVLIDMNSVCRG